MLINKNNEKFKAIFVFCIFGFIFWINANELLYKIAGTKFYILLSNADGKHLKEKKFEKCEQFIDQIPFYFAKKIHSFYLEKVIKHETLEYT